MLTPAIVVEILKSSSVICRAQPPFWMRLGARLNEAQNCGMPLTSVAGGLRKLGSWPASPGSCGPGSVNALGLVTLTAPSGGRSGLPKTPAAWAAAVIAANPPAASIARRERFAVIISLVLSTNASKRCFWVSFMTRDYRFHFLTQSSKTMMRIRDLPYSYFKAHNLPSSARPAEYASTGRTPPEHLQSRDNDPLYRGSAVKLQAVSFLADHDLESVALRENSSRA